MAKIKEIEVARSMTISTGNWENDKPHVRLVAELEEGEDYETAKTELIKKLNQALIEIVD